MGAARRPATLEDLSEVADHLVGEIIAGDLVTSPRPAGPHAVAASAAGGILVPPLQFGDGGPGGWWIVDEPELHLGEDVLVPDLAGWRRERLPRLPDTAPIDLSPDWVCAILSPSTARTDRVRKMPAYAREQVPHMWLIDPVAHTLEVYRLERSRWTLVATHGGDDLVHAEPFEDVGVPLGRLWGKAG